MPRRALAPLARLAARGVNDLPRQLQELLPLAGLNVEDVDKVPIRGVVFALATSAESWLAYTVAFIGLANGC